MLDIEFTQTVKLNPDAVKKILGEYVAKELGLSGDVSVYLDTRAEYDQFDRGPAQYVFSEARVEVKRKGKV